MVYPSPIIRVIKGLIEFTYFRRKFFPKDFLNSPVDFVQVGTTGVRGRIRILLPRVCTQVFVPVLRGRLRPGSPEAEPETGIWVHVPCGGDALRSKGEACGPSWSQASTSSHGEVLCINCTVGLIPAWGSGAFELCTPQSLATGWPSWGPERRWYNLPG